MGARGLNGNITLDDLKKMKELKDEFVKKVEVSKYSQNNNMMPEGEHPKQSLWGKIFAFVLLIGAAIGFVVVLIMDFDMLFLPSNSVKVKVVDQYGEPIPNLVLRFRGFEDSYTVHYGNDDDSEIVVFNVTPDDYTVIFEKVPGGYECPDNRPEFTLSEDSKVKLEYKCTKDVE